MLGLSVLPAHLRQVVEDYCRRREAEAEQRGYLRGKADGGAEITAGMKTLAAILPQYRSQFPLHPQVPISPASALAPTTLFLSQDPAPTPMAPEVPPEDAGPVDLADDEPAFDLGGVMDELFGATAWSDLDRHELIRVVMAAVEEAMRGRGKNPDPVLDILRGLADGESFDAAVAGGEGLQQMLSWQASPLKNPRGQFRFKAQDSATGNTLYGDKALQVMRRANRDRFAFNPGAADPAMQGQAFDLPGPASLDDHTEAYRKARENVAKLRDRLQAGDPLRPGDLMDYQDHISLMHGDDLRHIRSHLIQSLTKRVAAGKTKAERVSGIRAVLARLQDAVRQISTAVLKHAEAQGFDITPAEEQQVADDAAEEMEVLFEGELPAPLPAVGLSDKPNAPKMSDFGEMSDSLSSGSPAVGKVLAHIAGPSGSGKTTLLEHLAGVYPGIDFVDLDDFDDEAVAELGWADVPKKDFTDDMVATLADERQRLMDHYIAASDKPIVFGGHHTEDEHVLSIPTKNRWLLDVDARTSAMRAYQRSQHEEPQFRRTKAELPQDEAEAQRDIDFLKSQGYRPMSGRAISDAVGRVVNAGHIPATQLSDAPKPPAVPKASPPPAKVAETKPVGQPKVKEPPPIKDDAKAIRQHIREQADAAEAAGDTPLQNYYESAHHNSSDIEDPGVDPVEAKRHVMKRLIGLAYTAHKTGDRAIHEHIDKTIRRVPGVRVLHEPGDVVPFDPKHHDSDIGFAPRLPFRVERSGYQLAEPGGKTYHVLGAKGVQHDPPPIKAAPAGPKKNAPDEDPEWDLFADAIGASAKVPVKPPVPAPTPSKPAATPAPAKSPPPTTPVRKTPSANESEDDYLDRVFEEAESLPKAELTEAHKAVKKYQRGSYTEEEMLDRLKELRKAGAGQKSGGE